MSLTQTVDAVIARILFVTPQPVQSQPVEQVELAQDNLVEQSRPAQRAFSVSLLFSGIRCTLQYLILPVVLPLIGLAGDWSIGIVLLLDAIALTSIIYSLRYFWRINHPQKWNFLPLALSIIVLILFMLGYDIWLLLYR